MPSRNLAIVGRPSCVLIRWEAVGYIGSLCFVCVSIALLGELVSD